MTSPVEWKRSFQNGMYLFYWGFRLVDLVRFELTTSSMPWSHLQRSPTQTKDLRVEVLDAKWTPRTLPREMDSVWAENSP